MDFLDMVLKRIFCWVKLLPSVVPKWDTIKKDFSSFQIEGLHNAYYHSLAILYERVVGFPWASSTFPPWKG